MQLPLTEIWDFMELHSQEEQHWRYGLHAGAFHFPELKAADIHQLAEENHYDTELLPSIFTYREILWQPNVYDRPKLCLPGLKLLEAYCQEFVEDSTDTSTPEKLYSALVAYLAEIAHDTVSELESEQEPNLAKVLGSFRSRAFPIIQFFIWHPRNKPEHVADARKRLNYTVKILLTQYYKHYSELQDPFWQVERVDHAPAEKPADSAEAKPEEIQPAANDTASPTDISPSETT